MEGWAGCNKTWTEVFGSDRSAAGQADSPRRHPGDEWRKLQAEAERAGRRDAVFGLTCRPNPRLTRADIVPEQRHPGQI